MTLSRKVALMGGGFVVGALLVGGAAALFGRGAGEARIVLKMSDGSCVVDDKPDRTKAKKAGPMSWKIKNQCDTQYRRTLVAVGNFRTTEAATAATNCQEVTLGSAPWPFHDNKMDLEHRQHHQIIVLPVKGSDELPGDELTYYYDICIGPDAGVKVDPRLVIEE